MWGVGAGKEETAPPLGTFEAGAWLRMEEQAVKLTREEKLVLYDGGEGRGWQVLGSEQEFSRARSLVQC